jgi:branched-chain amino acid transport system ATP-binding protein
MLLRVRDLHVKYGPLEVLKGVSFEIEEGKISVLLGANGSGKSTLLKTISGLIPCASGSIFFGDWRIDKMPCHEIVRLGITQVPEGRRLFMDMTVQENLEMGAYSIKDKKRIAGDIADMYERFPILRQKRHELVGKLSGGQQQTLAIARALMSKPRLLLMDEPAQGLSPSVVSEIAGIVTGINRDGVTLIVVEHNLRLGLSFADWVYVLSNGEISFVTKSTDLSAVEYAKKLYLGG